MASSYIKFRTDEELDRALRLKVAQLEEEEGIRMSHSMLGRMILRAALTSDQTLRQYTDKSGAAPVEFPDLGALAELGSLVRQAGSRALARATQSLDGYLREELGKVASDNASA